IGAIVSSALAFRLRHTANDLRAQQAQTIRALKDVQAANNSARAVNEFLTNDVIGSADPPVTPGKELSLRADGDLAASKLKGRFDNEPITSVAVHNSVAQAYSALGRSDLAAPHAKEALELARRTLGEDHPTTLDCLNNYAYVLNDIGRT